MKNIQLIVLILLTQVFITKLTAEAYKNIVVIIADDLGWADLGCQGSTFYETPHLDALAASGARFTQAYAACQVCSPSRAALLTGREPVRYGVTDFIGAKHSDEHQSNTPLRGAAYEPQLALSEVTLAERLKAHQYATFFAGKWHLGSKGFWPTEQGFDINIAGSDSGSPKQGYFSPYKLENLSDGEAGEHLPERIAAETIKFIIQHRDQPFLAWVPFYDVHTPLQARPDLKKKYEDKRKRLNLETQWGIESPREVRLSQDDPVYAAMVEAMDTAAGKILQAIDDLHLREQTLVIFTSDNGGLSTNEGSPTSNQPLRGGKGWPYEGGIRVPLLMRCPGYTQAQQVIDLPVSGIDIVPTVLEFAKLKVDPATLDGHHLLHDLKAERTLYWHYPHYGNQGGAPCAILREGRWKLIEWMEDQRVELFDVNADISEKNDLSMTEPVIKKSLLDKLHSWQQQRNVKMPTANPNFDPNLPHGRSKKAPKKKKS